MLKIYEYEKCSTCKKALRYLENKKIKYEKIAIVENPPSKTELKRMLGYQNDDIKKLFNTSGLVYRELKLGDKLPKMSIDECIELLSQNGKLIKRPFLIGDSFGRVGFKEEEWVQ